MTQVGFDSRHLHSTKKPGTTLVPGFSNTSNVSTISRVEMAGIEPASDGWPRDILRVQSAINFSALGIVQTLYRMGSVNLVSSSAR